VASLSQGRTAAAQCGLFTYKSVPVIFEPPCISARRTFTEFLIHAPYLFYFPQNAVYFIILSFPVQIIRFSQIIH